MPRFKWIEWNLDKIAAHDLDHEDVEYAFEQQGDRAMSRRKKDTPPRPGMKWSERHQMWLDTDTRTPERRRRDEEILRDVEDDHERIDSILRAIRETGEPSAVEAAAAELASRLLESLIEARSRAGLSQSEVARRMGVPQSAIVRLEAGTHSPTLSTLARYASAIGADLSVRQAV